MEITESRYTICHIPVGKPVYSYSGDWSSAIAGGIFLLAIFHLIGYFLVGYWTFLDVPLVIGSFFIYAGYFSDEEYEDSIKSWRDKRKCSLLFDLISVKDVLHKKNDKFNRETWEQYDEDYYDDMIRIFPELFIHLVHNVIYSDKIKSFNKSLEVEHFYELNENQKWFNHFWQINDCFLKLNGNLQTIYVKKIDYDNFDNQNNLKVKNFDEIKKPVATKIIEVIKNQSQFVDYITGIVEKEELPNYIKIKKSIFVRSCIVCVPIIVIVATMILNFNKQFSP